MKLTAIIIAASCASCGSVQADSLDAKWRRVSLGMSKTEITRLMGLVHYEESRTVLGVRYERLVWWNAASLWSGSSERFYVVHLLQGLVVVATACSRPTCGRPQ